MNKEQNAKKYGEKGNDVIAAAYQQGTKAGHDFCRFTAIKYLTRFGSDSEKANNVDDLHKAVDFINRMIEVEDKEKETIAKSNHKFKVGDIVQNTIYTDLIVNVLDLYGVNFFEGKPIKTTEQYNSDVTYCFESKNFELYQPATATEPQTENTAKLSEPNLKVNILRWDNIKEPSEPIAAELKYKKGDEVIANGIDLKGKVIGFSPNNNIIVEDLNGNRYEDKSDNWTKLPAAEKNEPATPKFKEGDILIHKTSKSNKIKVLSFDSEINRIKGVFVDSEFKELIGETDLFNPDHFELYQHPFKVGDMVVEKGNEKFLKVKVAELFDNGDFYGIIWESYSPRIVGEYRTYHSSDFEIYVKPTPVAKPTPAPKREFKEGDIVVSKGYLYHVKVRIAVVWNTGEFRGEILEHALTSKIGQSENYRCSDFELFVEPTPVPKYKFKEGDIVVAKHLPLNIKARVTELFDNGNFKCEILEHTFDFRIGETETYSCRDFELYVPENVNG